MTVNADFANGPRRIPKWMAGNSEVEPDQLPKSASVPNFTLMREIEQLLAKETDDLWDESGW